jgi:hypothetical protein
MPKKQSDITGQKFNMLTAVEFVDRGSSDQYFWKFVCDCGNFVTVKKSVVFRGVTKSCGCIRKIKALESIKKHGMTNAKIYKTWSSMIQRCKNEKNPFYHRYGGRGITVCESWLKFENFYKDMGDRPFGFTLDRIDNNGNYEPTNCRWATGTEQGLNKEKTVKVLFNGELLPLMLVAEIHGKKYAPVKKRIDRGWSLEKALNEPMKK